MQLLGGRFAHSRVMILLLGVTLAASAALCVLAWRLTVLDRALQEQLASERLDQAVDLGRSTLLQQITRTGDQLRLAVEAAPDGRPSMLGALAGATSESTAILSDGRSWDLFPDRMLRYLPEVPSAPPVPEDTFAAGELLEYRDRNYAAAAQWFRALAQRSDGTLRAGALLRTARSELKRNAPARALESYGELERMGSTRLNDEPAALIARHARLPLLSATARTEAAATLLYDLEAGAWPLSRTSYRFYREELGGRVANVPTHEPLWEEAVHAVASLAREAESGERVVWVNGSQPLVLIWRSRAGSLVAMAVTARHVAAEWLTGERGYAYGVETAGSRILVPLEGGERRAERLVSFAGQDWRLLAAPTAGAVLPRDTRTLLWVGLSLLLVLILTGSYAVLRAVSRELAVAQLQADFVSAVSHEFRSPLTTLRSMSEMLERGRVPTEERKQRYYELMARETGRLHTLVEDLLDFGRMEAGARVYDLRPVDAADLVRQLVAEFQEKYAAAGFTVELSDEPAAPIVADTEALRRALRNLLDNAMKYSGDAREIRVAVRSDAGHVLISVQDHGMGISPQDLKRVFRKFERGAEAKASNIAGTGLGLALVSSMMRAHGGTVHVESEPNRGSTFTLSLPLAAAADVRIA